MATGQKVAGRKGKEARNKLEIIVTNFRNLRKQN